MASRLGGKVAVVTGAGSGIGRGSALVLARNGARVVVNDIDQAGGAETVRLIRKNGGEATFVYADVTRFDDVRALVANTQDVYGGLDIMHANAGITIYVDLDAMSENQLDQVLNVNLRGALVCSMHAVPAMKKRGGGAIVYTSSVLSTIGFPQCVVYSATKAAMIGAARTLAVEVGRFNIRVNCVSPGTIDTPMLARDTAKMNVDEARDFMEKLRSANALGRIGEPEEVGNAVAWLSSEESAYITGQNLFIDGAFTAVKRI